MARVTLLIELEVDEDTLREEWPALVESGGLDGDTPYTLTAAAFEAVCVSPRPPADFGVEVHDWRVE